MIGISTTTLLYNLLWLTDLEFCNIQFDRKRVYKVEIKSGQYITNKWAWHCFSWKWLTFNIICRDNKQPKQHYPYILRLFKNKEILPRMNIFMVVLGYRL